jgi:hypothetical protein
MLFLFAYGDIFGFFSPGQIQEVMAGEISGTAITQVFLFAVSLYIAIASVMVFLSLVLSPTVNRWSLGEARPWSSIPSWPVAEGDAAIPQSTRDHSNRAFSGRVMRFNKGIAANTASADRANPPSMVM